MGFDAFEWGIIKRRVVEGASEEDDDWTTKRPGRDDPEQGSLDDFLGE